MFVILSSAKDLMDTERAKNLIRLPDGSHLPPMGKAYCDIANTPSFRPEHKQSGGQAKPHDLFMSVTTRGSPKLLRDGRGDGMHSYIFD